MKSDLVGIYKQNQDGNSEPAFFLMREEARELKKANMGYFINHGNDMRLLEYVEVSIDDAAMAEIEDKSSKSQASRTLSLRTIQRAIGLHKNLEERKKLYPYLDERLLLKPNKRWKPLEVVAVESWA